MRKLFVGLLVALFALPAGAADCQTVGFDGGYITSRTGNQSTVRTGLVGSNLWVQVGEFTGQDEYEGTVSYEIGGSTGAVVCPDGSVTFISEAPLVPAPPPAPLVEERTETVEGAPSVSVVLHPGTGGYLEF